MHILPMEHPNKRFPSPPPFMYHPELQPELAKLNPTGFQPLEKVPREKRRKHVRNPASLGVQAVEAGSE